MKLKLTERETWILYGVLALVLVYVFVTYLFLPQGAEVGKLSQKSQGLNRELKTAKEKVKIFKELPGEKNNPKTKEEETINALKYLASEISKNKLVLQSLKPRPAEVSSGAARAVMLDLTFTGKYNAIYRFLQSLDRLPVLILVDSLSLTKSEGPLLNASLVVAVYY